MVYCKGTQNDWGYSSSQKHSSHIWGADSDVRLVTQRLRVSRESWEKPQLSILEMKHIHLLHAFANPAAGGLWRWRFMFGWPLISRSREMRCVLLPFICLDGSVCITRLVTEQVNKGTNSQTFVVCLIYSVRQTHEAGGVLYISSCICHNVVRLLCIYWGLGRTHSHTRLFDILRHPS